MQRYNKCYKNKKEETWTYKLHAFKLKQLQWELYQSPNKYVDNMKEKFKKLFNSF